MEENVQYFSILCFFILGKVKTQLKHKENKICAMYGGGVMTDQMCQKWFENFCAGDFLLDDALQSSRLVKADSQQTEALIDNNQHYTMRKIPS